MSIHVFSQTSHLNFWLLLDHFKKGIYHESSPSLVPLRREGGLREKIILLWKVNIVFVLLLKLFDV